jgi:hypothetical protein
MAALVLLLACDAGLLTKAASAAEAFDLRGALALARAAGECDEAQGIVEYLEGLLGAAQAVEHGGTVDSLRDVRSATNALSRRAEEGGRRWEAASFALRAVAAASQQERGEMSLYLAEATRLEAMLLAAGLPGAPLVSAHEIAGDLWLQVHEFAEARAAYERAASLVGRTPRVVAGLARAAEGLKDTAAACAAYASLFDWWHAGPRRGIPPEIDSARRRAESLGCERVRR